MLMTTDRLGHRRFHIQDVDEDAPNTDTGALPGEEAETDRIIARVLGGDTEAFAEIVGRYQRLVWKMSASRLLDPEVSENIVQQSFVSAYERLGSYERGRGFGAWIATIARNLLRNEIRRTLREGERLNHYRHYLLALPSDRDVQERQGLERAVTECRETLSPKAAQAVELRYGQALALEQVAQALGHTLNATRQLLFRARAAIRLCVEKKLVSE